MSGGTEWEQGRAVTRMVEALRANDHETMALAMADYAAALGTRTTNILSGIVTTVMLELHEMRAERQTGFRSLEHKIDLVLLAHDVVSNRLVEVESATLAHEIGADERRQLFGLIRTIPDLAERLTRLEAQYGALPLDAGHRTRSEHDQGSAQQD